MPITAAFSSSHVPIKHGQQMYADWMVSKAGYDLARGKFEIQSQLVEPLIHAYRLKSQ